MTRRRNVGKANTPLAYFLGLMIVFISIGSVTLASEKKVTMESCLAEMLSSAPDDMTIGELRTTCSEKIGRSEIAAVEGEKPSALDKRLETDQENILKPFTIMAHKQNYILLGAHNFAGYSEEEFVEFADDDDALPDDTEVQFQISIKTPLAIDLFDADIDIFAAYTVRSFWQLYNDERSSPFRETNHEPEAWVQFHPDFEFFGFKNLTALGFVHQSNGRSSNLSRSWNRVFANFIFNRGNFAISLKPWYRIQEDSEDDDNPDITDFLGHGEIRMAYKWDEHVFTFMSRNNIESGFSDGAVELGWSFPLWDFPYLKGYVQYFSGYGESLIDYDRYVNRIGLGLILTDLL